MMMTARCSANEPLQFQVVECLEEVLVVDLHLAILQSLVCYPHVLIIVAHLVGMWVQPAVRGDDAVTVEVIV